MSVKFELQVNWGANYSSANIWSAVCEAFDIVEETFEDEYTGEKLKFESIRDILERDDKEFFYRAENVSISLKNFNKYKLDRMIICPQLTEFSTNVSLFESIVNQGFCIWGRIFDAEYNKLQNTKDIGYLVSRGVDHSQWKKRLNGLPAPLEAEEIDISKNPGRDILRCGYIEAIGSIMWLSREWCKDRRVNVYQFSENQIAESADGYLLQFYDLCFNSWEGEQREIQDYVWRALYNNMARPPAG